MLLRCWMLLLLDPLPCHGGGESWEQMELALEWSMHLCWEHSRPQGEALSSLHSEAKALVLFVVHPTSAQHRETLPK